MSVKDTIVELLSRAKAATEQLAVVERIKTITLMRVKRNSVG